MVDGLKPQKRSRRIAMTDAERDAFLTAERTCRVATVGPDGPHATPLWFTWDGAALWLYSIVRSRRWVDLQRDPRVSVVVDAGEDYLELRGVEITGTVRVVGEVPRVGETSTALVPVERAFGRKYFPDTDSVQFDGRHAWLRLTPAKITSWDFRKITVPPGVGS